MTGRRVLVTGAGGSIGGALVEAVAAAGAARIVLVDASEFALYEIDRRTPGCVAVLGSAGDTRLMDAVFGEHEPEIVLHAAAYKHVPMLEANAFAAIANNALGTEMLLRSAARFGVAEFVLVSTDKAVEPASMMGASKRIAELLLLAHAGGATRMSAVRLGNVWGTQGSVLQLFREQIAKGVTVTVTDARATRFFMEMEAAVGAILGALEPRGEGVVVVPELGCAVRVADVAKRLIFESGSGVGIMFTGLRAGDKLEEKLIGAGEKWLDDASYAATGLRAVASDGPDAEAMRVGLDGLRQAVEARDLRGLAEGVERLVPGYRPSMVFARALEALA